MPRSVASFASEDFVEVGRDGNSYSHRHRLTDVNGRSAMEAIIMFAPSIWRFDRMVEGKVTIRDFDRNPLQHILAGWVVALVIGIAAFAASTL
jgi:hypothetical protein